MKETWSSPLCSDRPHFCSDWIFKAFVLRFMCNHVVESTFIFLSVTNFGFRRCDGYLSAAISALQLFWGGEFQWKSGFLWKALFRVGFVWRAWAGPLRGGVVRFCVANKKTVILRVSKIGHSKIHRFFFGVLCWPNRPTVGFRSFAADRRPHILRQDELLCLIVGLGLRHWET